MTSDAAKASADHNIKVCVRIRPQSQSELASNERVCVHRGLHETLLLSPEGGNGLREPIAYSFDWILPGDASQERVYEELGHHMVQGVADGFHGCALAYGQTSSGKSHTAEYLVKVSYLEIYNEKVRDLLTPGGASGSSSPSLEIRQHPDIGVFVEGLSHNVANAPEDVLRLLDFGHKIRVVGATNLNAASSRSHAVVTLHVERSSLDRGRRRVRRAQLHAVDLAGSERLANAGAGEARQKESKEINKSLLALSLMISKLASREQQQSRQGGSSNSSMPHIPYRSSKLTYLLSEAVMGNCRTVLLACVSPSTGSFSMTESTVHFASSAKKIRTRPVKNEDVDGCLVEALKAEIESLKDQLKQMGGDPNKDVVERMVTAQLLHAQLSPTKEELQAQSQAFECRRNQVLENLGLSRQQLASVALRGELPRVREDADPYLVNVCDDPLLSGCLMYALHTDRTVCVGSDPACAIHVEGLGIQPEMCRFTNLDGFRVRISVPPAEDQQGSKAEEKKRQKSLFKGGSAQVFLNNQLVSEDQQLQNKDRIRIGSTHIFQLFIPQEVTRNQQGHRVTELVDKMVAGCSSQNRLAQEFATHLRERIGKDRTLEVLRSLDSVQALVDEANEMTEELRGGESHEFEFKAQVLSDVTSVDTDPEVAVSLYVMERPEGVGPSGEWFFKSGGPGSRSLRALFSVEQFRTRLEALRDVYHEVECRDEPWGLAGDLDPWNIHDSVPRLLETVEGIV
eukprot:CAMPEP_0115400746 /NCGR_PEP_ID=MMETSP0271-20121206/15518_1 /TAXON_ID=71861 /ORGANISM="Scrippsiella trochoidea, Strain CCMP3099" /LENGTH=739 /DNA_ID=CAMNT_0002824613 /DNA_START=5 /DNA_END=2221 /DNA_ORIENTATION=-